MIKATCDFCPTLEPAEAIVPLNCTIPTEWADFRILCKGRAVKTMLMCGGCIKERDITVSGYGALTLADSILEEISDGIRDIVQDEIAG